MRKNVVMMTVLMVALVFALMLVAMPAVGAGDVACDWTGTWDTCWGKMELVQTGIEKWVADVNGTAYLTLPQRTNITYKPEGKITGLVFDNTLEGWWTRYPSNTIQRTRAYTLYDYTGNLVFTISEDCNSFEGEWWYGDRYKDDWGGVWTGSRVGPSKQASKQTVCASAKISITSGSEFTTAEFTIGGTEPQKVRITQPAENFGIVNVYGGKYGGRVYRRIDGKSWGSLTLEPGTYRLSCGGGGAMNLMSATVCIEYPGVEETPTGPEEEFPEVEHPPELPDPPGKKTKPSLPLGPIVKIVVRSADRDDDIKKNHLYMVIGQKKRFEAWGEDANRNKRGVTVDEWKVNYEDRGSIKKDGLFKAGPKEGWVKIRATAEGITGVFDITVTAVPLITFIGRVELLDEHNNLLRIPAGGLQVRLDAYSYKNSEGWRNYDDVDKFRFSAQTNAKGWFKFVVPAEVDHNFLARWYFKAMGPRTPPLPPGYYWYGPYKISGYSYEAEYPDKIEPGSHITVAPAGYECFKLMLGKNPTVARIVGNVTHRGKPVKDAKLNLLDGHGQIVRESYSDYDGDFHLPVDSLPKGRYRLTAQYKPKDPPKDAPWDPNNVITVHGWLYTRKDIPVDLPLLTEKKTINIKMISFAEKIGYTGP